jgi:hypothetical protein
MPFARPSSPFLGRNTDAQEHSSYHFSEELRHPFLFRTDTAPQKKRITMPMRLVEKTAISLESTHVNGRMPPSIHIRAEVCRTRQRSPCLAGLTGAAVL